MVPARGEQPADFRLRVVQVPEVHAARRAYGHAGRLKPLLHPVDAERALVRVSLGMDESGVVGARGHAGLAADALVLAHEHDRAERMDVAGPRRAARHAGGIVAVVAPLAADL